MWFTVVLRWCSDVDDHSSTSGTKSAPRRNSVEVCDVLYWSHGLDQQKHIELQPDNALANQHGDALESVGYIERRQSDYESARACGAYVLVSAANGASITVKITNECPLPCAPGQIDLSPQAFAKLADPRLGEVPITWKLLSPSMSDTISIRYKVGSSQWWCGIQVINHRNPVARLEVHTSSGWSQLPRQSFNYFISAHGAGCGDTIRITDIYGQQLTISGIALSADVVQKTGVQFAQH
jgi:hypothetical protein